jgi:hypothetical protein
VNGWIALLSYDHTGVACRVEVDFRSPFVN